MMFADTLFTFTTPKINCRFSHNLFNALPTYRQLDVDLPRQSLINQRPWLIAGLLLALNILLISA